MHDVFASVIKSHSPVYFQEYPILMTDPVPGRKIYIFPRIDIGLGFLKLYMFHKTGVNDFSIDISF